MSKIEKAVLWALAIAADPSHGYAQDARWGPDYDCSSFVISAFEQAGVPVKSRGATYTGNMRAVFLSCGFEDVTAQVNKATGALLQRGDVLLNELSHTALSLGGGRLVQASINERGRIAGGTPGDQTGAEIHERNYYNYPWDCVLRYQEISAQAAPTQRLPVIEIKGSSTSEAGEGIKNANPAPALPELSLGAMSEAVRAMQALLAVRGHPCGASGADADFGAATLAAVTAFQSSRGLDTDGICGANTWASLIMG